MKLRKLALFLFGLFLVSQPGALWACSVCYGETDSPMSKGLVWGIGVLLGVVAMVLSGIAGFFVYLVRKSSSGNEEETRTE